MWKDRYSHWPWLYLGKRNLLQARDTIDWGLGYPEYNGVTGNVESWRWTLNLWIDVLEKFWWGRLVLCVGSRPLQWSELPVKKGNFRLVFAKNRYKKWRVTLFSLSVNLTILSSCQSASYRPNHEFSSPFLSLLSNLRDALDLPWAPSLPPKAPCSLQIRPSRVQPIYRRLHSANNPTHNPDPLPIPGTTPAIRIHRPAIRRRMWPTTPQTSGLICRWAPLTSPCLSSPSPPARLRTHRLQAWRCCSCTGPPF